MNIDTNYQIKLIGYCSIGKESLLKRFVQEGPSSLADLGGEYLLVIENSDECYIITSPYGICQYYYTIHRNELFHDDTVIGVLQKSRLPWSWNWKALADLTQLDNVLENDTLHPQIHRVPAASILHFRQGVLKTSSLTWEELHPSFPASPDTALDALNDEIRQWLSDNVVVSSSGGFDSRVILSSILKHGCRPLLLTMGFDNSTDVVISRQIASDLGLQFSVVALDLEDYLRHGSRIVALTNGTKTAWNWHTYIYPKKAKLDSSWPFFVGTNGEFARSFSLDKGILALAANMVTPLSLRSLWKLLLLPIFKKEELNGIRSEFANEFTGDSQHARLDRLVSLCHNKLLSLLPGLDRFRLEQRERNFAGNGMKLYAEHVSWRVPFISRGWVSAVLNLGRDWKLGSNWHRFALAKNYPQLMDYPLGVKASKVSPRAPLLYWSPLRKKPTEVPYEKYSEWFQSDMIVEFIRENTPLLSELIEANTVISIVEEHKRKQNRTHTIAFLLTMIFWLMNLREYTRMTPVQKGDNE